MTTPVGKKVDPAAATVGTAEDSATGFELALYPDAVDAAAHHQGVVVAYADGSDDAVAVTASTGLPVTGSVSITGTPTVTVSGTVTTSVSGTVTVAPSTPDLPVSIGSTVNVADTFSAYAVTDTTSSATALVAGDLIDALQIDLGNLGAKITLRSVSLAWSTALWPADAVVDVYVYDALDTDVGFSGGVGDPWTCPLPAPADGSLVGTVRLTNECIGAAYGLVGRPSERFRWTNTASLGQATFYAVLTSGTGFTSTNPLTWVITYEVQV